MKTSKPPPSSLRRNFSLRAPGAGAAPGILGALGVRAVLTALAALVAVFVMCPGPALRAQTDAGIPSAIMKLPDVRPAKKPVSDKWSFSLLPVGLQRNPQVDYAIVTEMTDEGRKLPEPSFDNPVYYISHSIGQHDVGDAYGGTRPIQYSFLQNQLNSSLASNGYRPADDAHPPTQVLFITWGMFNHGYGGDILSRAKLIGGQKFADEFAQAVREQRDSSGSLRGNGPLRDFEQRDDLTETLVYAIFEECYYLLVTALDKDALQQNEKKILWTTKISTIARGVSFQATLPIMINNASYYFGRDTNGPELLRKRAYKRADVSIGEAKVVEYISGSTFSTGTAAGTTTDTATGTGADSGTGTGATTTPPPAENSKSQ